MNLTSSFCISYVWISSVVPILFLYSSHRATTDMAAVCHIRVYEGILQGDQGIFIKAMSRLDNHADTIWYFLWRIVSMFLPFQSIVHYYPEKCSLWNVFCYLLFDTQQNHKMSLFVFKDILLTFSHKEIPSSSVLISDSIALGSLPRKKWLVLSANRIGKELLYTWYKSLLYTRNKSGPKIEPWGTPHLIVFLRDKTPSCVTNCCRSVR